MNRRPPFPAQPDPDDEHGPLYPTTEKPNPGFYHCCDEHRTQAEHDADPEGAMIFLIAAVAGMWLATWLAPWPTQGAQTAMVVASAMLTGGWMATWHPRR